MNAADLRREVEQWVAKAEVDYRIAETLLKQDEQWVADDICFPAQQCAEKYLKARLILSGIHFRKTHNIGELLLMVPGEFRPRLSECERTMLTAYAAEQRYPGDYDPTTLPEARNIIRLARRVRNRIRRELPPVCFT